MAPHLLLYQLLLVALVVLCLLMHVWWPDHPRPTPQTRLKPDKPRRQRSQAPQPFTGFIHKPLCAACEQGADSRSKAPGSPVHPENPNHLKFLTFAPAMITLK